MMQVIGQDEYAAHVGDVQAIIRQIVPRFGFAPDETEAVVREHARLNGNWLLRIRTSNDQTAFCTLTKHANGWTLHSLFPSAWPDRYQIIREAFAQIKSSFASEATPGSVLHFGLNEDTPTHQFWFAALLPDLGFEMRPRISMSSELDRLMQTSLPELPPIVREIGFSRDRLSVIADCFTAGFSGLVGERNRDVWERELAAQVEQEDAVKSWSNLECQGKIIGSCYGRVHGGTAVIYELAVLPAFYGKGLGRFLLLRCAQQLKEHGGESCTRCALWTFRTLDRALVLYYRLGFKRDQLWTEARFTR